MTGRWTALSLVRRTSRYLEERGIPDPRLSAEHLLAHVLDCRRLDLYLAFDRPLSDDELDAYRALIRRRRMREPIAYIIGSAGFRDLELTVDRRVLVPRPETEQLVDEVLRWSRAEADAGRAPEDGWRMIDRGTGSGAIACALATELAGRHWILGIDASPDALVVARENARRLGIDRVRWLAADGFAALGAGLTVDAVIANPPYLADDERSTLDRQVVDWEPAAALFAGPRGLEAIEAVVEESGAILRAGGLLALEIGAGQLAGTRSVIDRVNGLEYLTSYRDLAGIERGVLALRTG